MPTLYYTQYSNQDVSQQRIVSAFLNREVPLQQIPNKYSPLILVDEQLVINQSNAISMHLAAGTKLLGSTFEEEIDVYSWLEYFNVQLYPILKEIYGEIFGKLPVDQQKYNYANQELKRIFKILDEKLKYRTLIVGDSLTLADIVFCCHLQKAFRLLATAELRKKFINLTRWYTYVRNLKPFVSCIGKMFLCEQPWKIDPTMVPQQTQNTSQTKKQQKGEQKSEKAGKKKEEKKQQKKQVEKQKEVKKQEKQQKKVQQKQGQFNLDSFKRAFQNTENKSAVIDEMLQNLGEGWSIWKVYYSKDVTEGKVDYLTCNLAKGTLQRLDALRKTGFGNWGVYFSNETKEYQIRGVMLWKGQDVATAWKEHPSHEYHIFEKLNPKQQDHQKIIKDYWLESEICEGLALHISYRLI